MTVWAQWSDRASVCCSMHGGAGALMSIGLMERLPLSFMDRCMSELARSSGGDALISVCLWKAGYAFTDPGYSFYHWEAKSFDPGPENSAGLLSHLGAAIVNSADQYSLVRAAAQDLSICIAYMTAGSIYLHCIREGAVCPRQACTSNCLPSGFLSRVGVQPFRNSAVSRA